jgi:hypothetical protein
MIHTDTNIWYRLNPIEENIKELIQLDIRPNFINLLEIGSSYNTLKNPGLTKRAIENMAHFSNNIFIYPPLQQILHEDLGVEFPINLQKMLVKYFEYFLNTDDSKLATNLDFLGDTILEFIKEEELKTEKFRVQLHEILDNSRKIFKKKTDRLNYIENQKRNFDSVYNLFNLFSLKAMNIELPKQSFLEREFFISIINEFFTGREVHSEAKFKANDFNDLFIMMYVKKGNQYWTLDNYWNNLAKSIGKRVYIFEGDKYLNP